MGKHHYELEEEGMRNLLLVWGQSELIIICQEGILVVCVIHSRRRLS